MELERIEREFSICKIKDMSAVHFDKEFMFLGKTEEEISLVCVTEDVPDDAVSRDDGWKAFRIQGILDFSLTGILSGIAGLLAESHIGIFAISTYNTDYILTKKENFEKAMDVLSAAGYRISRQPDSDGGENDKQV